MRTKSTHGSLTVPDTGRNIKEAISDGCAKCRGEQPGGISAKGAWASNLTRATCASSEGTSLYPQQGCSFCIIEI